MKLLKLTKTIFITSWKMKTYPQVLTSTQLSMSYKLIKTSIKYSSCTNSTVFMKTSTILTKIMWYATKHTDKKFEAALSVFVDRAIGLVCTIAMAGFYYWLIVTGDDALDISGKDGETFPFLLYAKWVFVALGAAEAGTSTR